MNAHSSPVGINVNSYFVVESVGLEPSLFCASASAVTITIASMQLIIIIIIIIILTRTMFMVLSS